MAKTPEVWIINNPVVVETAYYVGYWDDRGTQICLAKDVVRRPWWQFWKKEA